MKNVKCRKCGWVHFERSLADVSNEIVRFNNWFYQQPDKVREMYGGKPSSLEGYTCCFRCDNSYKDFVDADEGDVPYGSTIQPILSREADL